MYRSNIILSFKTETHKRVCIFNSIDKIASSLYHALIDEFAERFVLTNFSEIIKKFIPETAVYQVARSMFGASYI